MAVSSTTGSSTTADVDCTSTAVASTRRRPSDALTVSVRVLSRPASGRGDVVTSRTRAVSPGPTVTPGGSKKKPTASSGSLPASCTVAGRLAAELSTTTASRVVSRSLVRATLGSIRTDTGASTTGTDTVTATTSWAGGRVSDRTRRFTRPSPAGTRPSEAIRNRRRSRSSVSGSSRSWSESTTSQGGAPPTSTA